jgi:cytoskeletal protein CcmA (bactofilin family)
VTRRLADKALEGCVSQGVRDPIFTKEEEEEGETEGQMALKGFKAAWERGLEAAQETPKPLSAASPAPRTVAPASSVDAGSELEGRLRCKQTLRIDGCIKGEVECEKTVLVGEGARVLASIAADEVQIAGLVEGDITARRKITLQRTAVVSGDLTTPGIVIEEGAKLKGRILIGSDAVPALDAVVAAEPARDAKKAPALKKPPAAGPKPSEAPAPQPVTASA